MNKIIDKLLRSWLDGLSKDWSLPVEYVANSLGISEIKHRFIKYPVIAKALQNRPFDFNTFTTSLRRCWPLSHTFQAIRVGRFLENEDQASRIVLRLVSDFPSDNANAISRINMFLDEAVINGFSHNYKDWAGAALFASVLLSSLYPKRFVDFRMNWWIDFAKHLHYKPIPTSNDSYGEWFVWASHFMNNIISTRTYKQYWPGNNPSWIISGICWTGVNPDKPPYVPMDVSEVNEFPEGELKFRMHLLRERNRAVVVSAKELRLQIDPLLKCEVCSFSFRLRYGERGSEFIEAHHKIPLSELSTGVRTCVNDIALLCSNCHRMIHRGSRSLSIEDLRILLM